MKIGIVLGSREGRNGKQVADWVVDYAKSRNDEGVEYELIGTLNHLIYHYLELLYQKLLDIQRFSETMAACDGYVFVTPEYNCLVPGAFKMPASLNQNYITKLRLCCIWWWLRVGLSAIESLRISNAEQELASVRTMVTFSLMADFEKHVSLQTK